MKKALVMIVAVLISLAFVTASFAQAPPEKSATMDKPSKPKSMTYSGEVMSVDSAANTVVVKGKKGEMPFNLATTKWKGYKSADGLKPGDKVTVQYVEKDGKMMATMVSKSWTKRMKADIKKEEKKIKEKLTPEEKSEPKK